MTVQVAACHWKKRIDILVQREEREGRLCNCFCSLLAVSPVRSFGRLCTHSSLAELVK